MRLRHRAQEPEADASPDIEVVGGVASGGIATKVLFAPVKITAKRIAPKLSKSLFERIWSAVGRGECPSISRLASLLRRSSFSRNHTS